MAELVFHPPGSTFHYTVHGSNTSERFFAANGNKKNQEYFANGGNDEVHAKDGQDWVHGGSGHDALYGDNGNDTLIGGSGDDRLFGLNHNDVLIGGDGNDKLYGGDGNDEMTGGNGADIFYFGGSGFSGIDTITDFNPHADKLGLGGAIESYRIGSMSGRDGIAISLFDDNSGWLGAIVVEGDLSVAAIESAII